MITPVVTEANPKPQRKTLQSHPAALREYRSRTSLAPQGNAFVGHCPFPDHSDSDPSFNIFLDSDGETWLHKCWGCHRAGNILQFIAATEGVTLQEARETFQEAVDVYDPDADIENPARFRKLEQPQDKETLPLGAYFVNERHLENSPEGRAYLDKRGILPETAKRFHLGFRTSPTEANGKPNADKGWIAIPYIYGDVVKLLKYRSIVAKKASEGTVRRKGMETCLFNADTIDATDMATVYLVSGEMDAITLEQAGFRAISLPSDSIKITPEMKQIIQNGWQIVLAGDNDGHVRADKDSGERKMLELWNEFPGSLLLQWPEGVKDANQAFVEYCKEDIAVFQALVTRLTAESRRKPIDAPKTDIGNALRFNSDHATKARYCFQLKKWLVWDGTRWVPDPDGRVYQLAKDTIRSVHRQADELEDKARTELIQWGLKSQSAERVKAMLQLAQSEMPIALNTLDTDPMLFNVLNGTIDLSTGELRPHRQGDLITKVAPVKYDPAAVCPIWNKFLERIFANDHELIGFVQRAAGYSLTGQTGEEVFFLLHGGGRRGKSKLIGALQYMMGDYAQTTDFNTFLISNHHGARNDIAALKGARLITASESEDGQRLAESVIKQFTGGDMIAARFLFGEYFEYKPQGKIWLSTNNLFAIRGTDNAIWERIKYVPFNVEIPRAERDRHLAKRLEKEASGILNWVLEGLRQYQVIGLGEPVAVTKATSEYRENQDVLARFIADECVVDKTKAVQAKLLYSRFKGWAETNGEFTYSHRKFSERLAEKGYESGHNNKGKVWFGISLRTLSY